MGEERAFAKVNLTLDVLGRREDGYHDLKMIMVSVDLWDTLRFFHEGEGLQARTSLSFLPSDGHNLAVKAALAFENATGRSVAPLMIELEKHIPVCAGTAGGSSDAAAVLRYLNRVTETGFTIEELCKIGETVGSDVPYCVMGGTALAEGRGEKLTSLPDLLPCWFVLCKPGFPISTPTLFHQLDKGKIRRRPDTVGMLKALEEKDLAGVARRLYNVFEDVLQPRQRKSVEGIKSVLISQGALGAVMTGTGPTVFGIFSDETMAKAAFEALKADYPETFLCRSV